MITIYHVPKTRSVRPLWLCLELNVPFDFVLVDFSPDYRNSLEWRAISPAGKIPVLKDDDVTMFESGAMVEFILDRYGEGRLRPKPRTAEHAAYLQWSWFAEATLVRPLGLVRLMKTASDGASSIAKDTRQKVETALRAVEQGLANSEFLLPMGFSAADIMMGYSLELLSQLNLLEDSFPNAQAYLARLKARDACKTALNA